MRWRALIAGVAVLVAVAYAPLATAGEPSQPRAASRPSAQVVAFYYGWYGNPAFDGEWIHWNDPIHGAVPPDDISSDYYPVLGAYSSRDPAVLRQHMAWLKRAKVGVIALSWWAGETSDAYVRQLLDAAGAAGIKVTFHIEPAGGRTAANYQANVLRLLRTFGKHPALFTTTAGSPYLRGGKPRPLIFVWATNVKDLGAAEEVQPRYWAKANDAIHRQAGALVVACPCGGRYDVAVREGHFDGAYNYATLHLDEEQGFDWARSLPPKALYIPSVIPGNHADRIDYAPETRVPRRDGAEYDDQWTAALGTGIVPDLVSITSFNELHEGSQIEPVRPDFSAGGRTYLDFLPQSPAFYLDQTARWVTTFMSGDYPRPVSTQVRVRISTSSDWLAIQVTGGAIARPGRVQSSPEATNASFDGTQFTMNQPPSRAQSGQSVSLTVDGLALGSTLTLVGRSGYVGQTTLRVETRSGSSWVPAGEATWIGGPDDDGATRTIVLPGT